jgi:hypothetical protein
MAEDIARHLAGEPVRARPATAWYRMAKLAGRHRMAVATGVLVTSAGLAGAGVAALQARRATEAAEQAQVVKQFVIDAFRASVQDDPLAEGGDASSFERLLERNAQLIERGNAPRLQAELYGTVARLLMDEKSYAKARVYAQKQNELLAALKAPPAERAEAALQLSELLLGQGDATEAAKQAQRAFELAGDEQPLAARVRQQQAAVSQAVTRAVNEAIGQAASASGASTATGAGLSSSPGR